MKCNHDISFTNSQALLLLYFDKLFPNHKEVSLYYLFLCGAERFWGVCILQWQVYDLRNKTVCLENIMIVVWLFDFKGNLQVT